MYCTRCGAEIADGNKFCTKCGAEVKKNAAGSVSKHDDARHTGGTKRNGLIAGIAVAAVIVCLGAGFMIRSFVVESDREAADNAMSDDIDIAAEEMELVTETSSAVETTDEAPVETLRQEDTIVEDNAVVSESLTTAESVTDSKDDTNIIINVEEDVAQIKEWYYDTQNRLDTFTYSEYDNGVGFYFESGNAVKGVVPAGYNDLDYTRQYFYQDQKLYFAFIFKGSEEYRLYFKDGIVIRYIDSLGDIYDYGNTQNGGLLGERVVAESDELYPY